MPGGDHPGEVVVTSRDMYDQLVRLTKEVQDMSAPIKAAGLQLADHEARLRGLERWRYALPVSLILAAGSVVASILLTLLGGH